MAAHKFLSRRLSALQITLWRNEYTNTDFRSTPNVPVCHSFFLASHFSFAVALFQQARAAYPIAIAGGFDGVHRPLLDVAIERSEAVSFAKRRGLLYVSWRLAGQLIGDARQFVRKLRAVRDKSQIIGAANVL